MIFQSLNPQQMSTFSGGIHNRSSSGYNANLNAQKNIDFVSHQKTASKKIDRKKGNDYVSALNKNP